MSVSLTVNGVSYSYPEVDDIDWGAEATGWATAVTSGMLQKAGGLFQLLAEVDFGTTYGVKSLYYVSRTASPADAGQVRLAKTDVVSWRNNAGGGNLDLGINGSDQLEFNGAPIQGVVSVTDTATIDLTFVANVLNADVKAVSIDNSMIAIAAGIAYSKLTLTGSIVDADVNASAAIAQSKLNLSITNNEVNAAAAIALTKLATVTGSKVLQSSAGGVIEPSSVTTTTLGYLDATSSIQSQLNAKQATGNYITALTGNVTASGPGSVSATIAAGAITNSMVNASAAIDFSKLATLTSGNILLGSAGNVATSTAVTGDVTITNGGVTAIASGVIVNGDINASAAIDYSKLAALTSANILVGSSGNVATVTPVTGDISITNGGVTAYAGTVSVAKGGTGQTSYTDGQVLIGNTSGNTLTKATLTAGAGVSITNGNGSISIASTGSAPVYNYTAQSTTYNAVISDAISCSGASFTITLPTAVSVAGKSIIIAHRGTSLTQVYTLNTTSSQTISGIASGAYALYTANESVTVQSDGANWFITDSYTQSPWVNAGAMTIGATSVAPTKGTTSVDRSFWRRDGTMADIRYDYVQSGGSPAAGTGNYLFTLPTTLTLDTAVVTVQGTVGSDKLESASSVLVNGKVGTAGANTHGPIVAAQAYSSTQLAFIATQLSSFTMTFWSSSFFAFSNSALAFSINLRVPIVNWRP